MYNDVQPTYFPIVPRIIVIGDVHGDISRLLNMLYKLKVISPEMKWIAEPPNTIVIQLGDQIDSLNRGSQVDWEVLPDIEVVLEMDKLDKIARAGGGRILSLLGNHEIMNFIGEFSYVSENSKKKYDIEKRQKIFAPGNTISTILAKRNIVIKIGQYLFCHGGLLPHHLDLVNNNLHIFNENVRKILMTPNPEQADKQLFFMSSLDPNSILWTRQYFELALTNEDLLNGIIDTVLARTDSKVIFVGHNTVPKITPVANMRVFLTDAALSRSYGNEQYQVLEILTDLQTNEPTYNVLCVT